MKGSPCHPLGCLLKTNQFWRVSLHKHTVSIPRQHPWETNEAGIEDGKLPDRGGCVSRTFQSVELYLKSVPAHTRTSVAIAKQDSVQATPVEDGEVPQQRN